MTMIHLVQCNRCVNKAPAEFNGEHWLPADGWIELTDPIQVKQVGHLCPICNPLYKPEPKKRQTARARKP